MREVIKSKARILLFLLVVAVFSACGGGFRKFEVLPGLVGESASGYHPYRPVSDYDPFAPRQERTSPSLDTLRSCAGLIVGDFKLVGVDGAGEIVSPSRDSVSISLSNGSAPTLTISLRRPAYDGFLCYVIYPSSKYTPTLASPSGEISRRSNIIFFSATRVPGVIGLGILPIGKNVSPIPAGLVATITFSRQPYSVRSVSAVADKDLNVVDDLTASINPDGTVLLSWQEKHPGDYNNDGVADIGDIPRVAENFFGTRESLGNPGLFELVNGNGDDKIDIADVAVLAENFFTEVTGYSVYRTLLVTQDEDPDPKDTGRWQRLRREGAQPPDAPPTVFGQHNGQDFRLPYSVIDRPSEPGFYAYFVRPFSKPEDNPNEGAISIVAKTSQPTGQSSLFLTVVNTEGRGNPPIFVVGETVILKVSIENAFSVFSANVRFLYRGDVLELLQDDENKPVPFIEGYEQNLLYESVEPPPVGGQPLFLGLDVGDATADGFPNYRWVGMNATKKKPAQPASGNGALGYFRFRVKAGGGEPITTIQDAFRFPSSTVFIYLMGEQYGVFLPPPIYTDTETIAIASP